MIPARYAATRFPYKLVQLLDDRSIIRHTYRNVVNTGLFDEVMVVTDSAVIMEEIEKEDGKVIKSLHEHESGSDRIAEAVEMIEVDVVVNVQGDEPFVQREPLEQLLALFKDPEVQVASLMKPFTNQERAANPNVVKVVTDLNGRSLMFSRSPIPYFRDAEVPVQWQEHIGIYAFRKEALLQFTRWPVSPLEAAEKIECLRYLENGLPLKMVSTNMEMIKIDVPDDLLAAQEYLRSQKPQREVS